MIENIEIGEILVLLEDRTFISRPYKKDDQFKVIHDGVNGFSQIEDKNGVMLYGLMLHKNRFVLLKEIRNNKLTELGI